MSCSQQGASRRSSRRRGVLDSSQGCRERAKIVLLWSRPASISDQHDIARQLQVSVGQPLQALELYNHLLPCNSVSCDVVGSLPRLAVAKLFSACTRLKHSVPLEVCIARPFLQVPGAELPSVRTSAAYCPRNSQQQRYATSARTLETFIVANVPALRLRLCATSAPWRTLEERPSQRLLPRC